MGGWLLPARGIRAETSQRGPTVPGGILRAKGKQRAAVLMGIVKRSVNRTRSVSQARAEVE